MLSYEDALARVVEGIVPLGVENVPIAEAAGRALAANLAAKFDQPAFDASAMDGYAVRFEDLPGPLALVGENAAGTADPGRIEAGETRRIFTGAALPEGADTILVQEDAAAQGDEVRMSGDGPPRVGAHVRKRAHDFADGAALLTAPKRLSARDLSLAAAGGHGAVPVRRYPRVALIANGDELVPLGDTPGPGQIVASSGPMIAAQLAAEGAAVDDFGIVSDDLEALHAAFEQAKGFDLVVSIGGASVGDHDLVKPALERAGAEMDFWRVAIRPGKPLIHGRLGDAVFLGLPGNPVSSFVCALLFAVPVIRAMQGLGHALPLREARLGEPLPGNDQRRDHLRAVVEGGVITPLRTQDSSQLAILSRANALIVREPDAPAAAAGEQVRYIALDSESHAA